MRRKQEKDRLDKLIGKNIQLEREACKLTRDELSEMIEMTTSHMGLIERGERGATAVTLSKISRVLDIPIDKLFANSNSDELPANEGENAIKEQKIKKIQRMLACLDDPALDFVIHSIKGIKSHVNAIISGNFDSA